MKKIIQTKKVVGKRMKRMYAESVAFLKRRPMASFFIALGLLFVVLLLGKITQKTVVEKPKEQLVKNVSVYSIGEAPRATFQAKIEKSGVVKIIAQAPGVVQNISVSEGDEVWKGQQIISLSTNYQGGNAGSVQRQVSQTQYQNVLDTYDQQKDVIHKQKDVANATDENSDKMREIARKSLDETNSLIDGNQSQLDGMNQSLADLIASNPSDTTESETLKGTINQLQGGINQLKEAARSIDYSSSNDNPQAKLSDLQKDITIKQLDLQEKGLDLTKEVSRLQLSLAYINEAIMYPASPFSGVVERVYVHEGQLVNPGTVLASVTSNEVKATAVLTVPDKIASVISKGLPSELIIGDKKVAITPYYVSSQATDGQLRSVFYDIPETYQKEFSDGEFVTINVPIEEVKTTATDPLLPIDGIYQAQDQAFVLVVAKDKAQTKTVKLGEIFGSYVQVLSGLVEGDQVILDRNVIAGDRIKIK